MKVAAHEKTQIISKRFESLFSIQISLMVFDWVQNEFLVSNKFDIGQKWYV